MKKLGFLLFLVLGLTACGDDSNDPAPEQHVTCAISSPTEGETIDIAEKMTIKGEATVDIGQISNVTLKIGDKQISEVTSVWEAEQRYITFLMRKEKRWKRL